MSGRERFCAVCWVLAWPAFHAHWVFHHHLTLKGEREHTVKDSRVKHQTCGTPRMLLFVDALHPPNFEAFHDWLALEPRRNGIANCDEVTSQT